MNKADENKKENSQSLDESILKINKDQEHYLKLVDSLKNLKFFPSTDPKNEISLYIRNTNNKYTDALRANQELKDTIAQNHKVMSVLRHDLRSPIGAMSSIVDLCLETYEQLAQQNPELMNSDFVERMNMLKEASNNCFNTFTDYDLWSRTNMDKPKLNLKQYDISTLIDKNESDVKIRAKNKNIDLICEPYLFSENQAFTDRSYVDIVLNNLISNSIKFTPEGKNIYVSAEPFSEKYFKITVHDEGNGIPADIKDKLFSVEGITTNGTAGEKGTGKGLMICKELVEKQGGKIWVDKETDYIGTKIHFTVPKYLQ